MVQTLKAPEVIDLDDTFPLEDDVPLEGTFPLPNIESDEPELESSLHLQQIFLLLSCLELLWQERNDYFAAGNLTVYYKEEQLKIREFRGPDFFVVLGTERKHRKSWVVYHEGGVYPHVIVEILSPSTAQVDRTTKKLLYQNTFRTLNYFWFHPETLEFQGFILENGKYEEIKPSDRGFLWSDQLELFLGIHDQKLRYFTEAGELVPSPDEARIEAQQQAELARQEAELANQRADGETQRAEDAIAQAAKLAAKLRELNIDPEQI